MRVSQIIRSLQWFVVPSLVFALVALFFTMRYGLASTQIWFNQFYTDSLDAIMPSYTYLGDGLVFAFLLLPFAFLKRQAFMALLFGALITLVSTAATKAYFDEPRPLRYFEQIDYELRQVPGVEPHYRHSFPSGHTTAAFAAWGILAFFIRKPSWQVLFFSIALGVAYSRIYLSMHFLRDVGAGALLGTFIAILAVFLSGKLKGEWLSKKWFGN